MSKACYVSTEKVIEEFKLVWGDRFDYSKVIYNNCKDKVEIICKEHGSFFLHAWQHRCGTSCYLCGRIETGRKLKSKVSNKQEEFIKACILANNDKYDYSKVIYTGSLKNIEIICPVHGLFLKRAHEHKNGKGCQQCILDDRSNSYASNLDEWIAKAKIVHGDIFSYEKSEYYRSNTPIIIICKIHGDFLQTPEQHLKTKFGCKLCSNLHISECRSKDQDMFIQQAKNIHSDLYDYSNVVYINTSLKIDIICKKHGIFQQTGASHLQGTGCPKCRYRISRPALQWLKSLNNPNLILEYRLSTGKFADAYDPTDNHVYMFHGDYWHGNPLVFPSGINQRSNKTFKQLYEETLQNDLLTRNAGYKLSIMWEYDWKIKNKLQP